MPGFTRIVFLLLAIRMTIRGVIGPVHFRSEDFLEQEQLLLLLMMLYMLDWDLISSWISRIRL